MSDPRGKEPSAIASRAAASPLITLWRGGLGKLNGLRFNDDGRGDEADLGTRDPTSKEPSAANAGGGAARLDCEPKGGSLRTVNALALNKEGT